MILVTGGTGLIGAHLLLNLVLKNDRIRALKRNSSSTIWIEKVFKWYRPEDYNSLFNKIEWVNGDINDLFALKEAVQGVDLIYHCAAVVSYFPSDREQMMKINVEGTANLVNVALTENVKKICHCSSIASLGAPDKDEYVDESFFWKTSPRNSYYAISKFNSEREIWRGAQEGLEVVVVNPSVVIGPGDTSKSSGKIFGSVLKGLKFYSDGVIGFVDARDVANIMIKLMESNISNERFILNGENLSFKDLFFRIAKYYGISPPKYNAKKILIQIVWRIEWLRSKFMKSKPLITKEAARSANRKTRYSNKKIKNTLSYEFISIDDSIKNACDFYKKHS